MLGKSYIAGLARDIYFFMDKMIGRVLATCSSTRHNRACEKKAMYLVLYKVTLVSIPT